MKKKWLFLALLPLMLTGCGKSSKTSKNNKTNTSNTTINRKTSKRYTNTTFNGSSKIKYSDIIGLLDETNYTLYIEESNKKTYHYVTPESYQKKEVISDGASYYEKNEIYLSDDLFRYIGTFEDDGKTTTGGFKYMPVEVKIDLEYKDLYKTLTKHLDSESESLQLQEVYDYAYKLTLGNGYIEIVGEAKTIRIENIGQTNIKLSNDLEKAKFNAIPATFTSNYVTYTFDEENSCYSANIDLNCFVTEYYDEEEKCYYKLVDPSKFFNDVYITVMESMDGYYVTKVDITPTDLRTDKFLKMDYNLSLCLFFIEKKNDTTNKYQETKYGDNDKKTVLYDADLAMIIYQLNGDIYFYDDWGGHIPKPVTNE